MDSLIFIAIVASFCVVLIWYVQNAVSGSPGARGLLAIAPDPAAGETPATTRRYRVKTRVKPDACRQNRGREKPAAAAPAFEEKNPRAKTYREMNEPRYRKRV